MDGDLRIVEVRRRCRSFKVLPGELPGLVCLASLLPCLRDFDPAHYVLVAELLHPSASLAALHLRPGDPPPALAARWGQGLGIVHRSTAATFHSRPRSDLFPGALPAFLTAHRGEAPPAGREWTPAEHVLGAVRGHTGFPAALEALCADWRPACLLQGDLRWDNVLFLENRGEDAAFRADWCHGAVGIGLSRLRAWELSGSETCAAEAAAAVRATVRALQEERRERTDWSPCHGTAGRLELLSKPAASPARGRRPASPARSLGGPSNGTTRRTSPGPAGCAAEGKPPV